MRVLCLASVLVVVLLAAAVSPHALSSPPTLSSRSTSGLPVHASLHLERTWHVQFTVSNPSRDQPVSILRWFTPLEQVLATRDLFEVSELADNDAATPLPYVGKLAKRNDALAAAEHFVTLEAGSSYSQVVDLSHGYVFEAGKRYVVRVSGKASMLVTADGVSARVKLTDVLAAGKVVATAPALEFRADNTTVLPQLRRKDRKKRSPTAVTSPAWEVAYSENNCAGHTSFNTQAVAAVRAGLVDAVAYTDSSCEDAQYTEWFGTVTTTRYTRVKEICAMSKTILDSSAFTIYCNPPDCDSGTFAYVYPSDPSLTIHVCGAYFSAPLDLRTNSAPGTLFHEASHFNYQGTSGTDDHVYGPTGARSLAQSNPNNAVDNADSFEYFLEQGLDLSGCGAGSGTGSSGDGSSGASEDPIDGPLSTSVGFFDACAEQQITTGGAICSGTSTFDMTGFAASGSYVGDCSTTATSPDGFLRFIAPATGTLTLETLDSTMDTVLMITEGCEASAVACNDDSVGTLSKLSFGVTEGTLYSIRVATWNGGAASTFTLAHSMNVPCAASTPSATGTGEAGSGGTDATPTATGDDEPTPSATGDDEPTPSATGDNEPTPSATGGDEPTPSATGDDEPTPSATADSGSTPTPSATADSDSPSATADAGDNPTPTGTAAGDTDLTDPPGNDTDASSSSTSSFESIGIYVGAGVIILVVILIWLRRRRRKEDDKSPASSSQSSLALNPMTTQSSAAVGAAPWAQRQIQAHRQSFTGELPHHQQQQQQQHYPQQQYYTQQQQQQQQQQHYPQQQYYTQQQQQQQHHHYPQQHNPAEPPLPPGWQMLHDQNGVPYYYRAAAPGVPGVTQWTRPLG